MGDDHEINYFYNLLMNGQMDRVMDAFYHDADYYYNDDYYGDYYEDETPSLGILVKTIKRFMAHKPYTGDDNDPDAFRYGFITDPEKCQPLGNWCQPMSYIHPDARSALTTKNITRHKKRIPLKWQSKCGRQQKWRITWKI